MKILSSLILTEDNYPYQTKSPILRINSTHFCGHVGALWKYGKVPPAHHCYNYYLVCVQTTNTGGHIGVHSGGCMLFKYSLKK